MTLNIAMFLENAAQHSPDQTYLIAGETHASYREINTQACRVANALSGAGIQPGERVALLLPSQEIYLTCHFAVLKLGAVPLPINLMSPAPEIAGILEDAQVSALIAHEAQIEAALQAFQTVDCCRTLILANLPGSDECPQPAIRLSDLMAGAAESFETYPTRPDDLACILYTAGTTGRPKGVALTHFNWYFLARFLVDEFWQMSAQDRILIVTPLSHLYGQAMLTVGCAAQASICMLPRFEPEAFFRTIQTEKITFFAGVPTLAHLMLHHPLAGQFDLSSLRRVMFGGSPLHAEIAARFKGRFNVTLITGYGLTEGVPITYLNASMYESAPPGSIGLPAFGTRVRIVDDRGQDVARGEHGEIVVRGPQMFREYFNHPDETATAWNQGWFHTGDLGYMDEQGYFFIVERLKDIIKTSGYTVYPAEVERALNTHPAVAEAAAIGSPHEMIGEVVMAYVALKPGASATPQELVAYCKTQLAAYKSPRRVEILPSLPKSPAGKVLRRALRERMEAT